MWFSFPKGAESITIERQNYKVEVKDAYGKGYFRAPAHFAPRILAINGFAHASDPTHGTMSDMPTETFDTDAAIKNLAESLEAKDMENRALREDLIAARSQNVALGAEIKALTAQLGEAKDRLADLTEQLEDKPAPAPPKKAA